MPLWWRALSQKFGVATPFGGPTSSGMLTLHCPPERVHALTSFLRENGAEAVAVADLDYVFSRDNLLYAKLEAGAVIVHPCLRNTTKCESEKLTTKLTRIEISLAASTGKHKGQSKQRRRAGHHAGDAGGDEGAVVAPAQNAARFRTEGGERIHRIGKRHRHQPGQHVGRNQWPHQIGRRGPENY